jgi:phosphohistidine swiveling domain-containing protein
MRVLQWLAGKLARGPRGRGLELVTVRVRRLARCYRAVLGSFVDAAEKQGEGFVLGRQYVVSLVERLFRLGYEMVFHANALRREAALDAYARLDALKARAKARLEPHESHNGAPLVIAVGDVDDDVRSDVGERLWSYCELGNRLGVPVSGGFVITAAAWREACQAAREATNGPGAGRGSVAARPPWTPERVTAFFRTAPAPQRLVDALEVQIASFPGNVAAWVIHLRAGWSENASVDVGMCVAARDPRALARAYLEGVASAAASLPAPSGPAAAGDLPAAALCLPDLGAEVTGSLFTVDPASPYSGRMRVEVERGDREQVVWLSRQPPFAVVPTSPATDQELMVDHSVLLSVARMAGRVERFCSGPREFEWLLARDGRPVVTWVQPLPPLDAPPILPETLAEARRRQQPLLAGVGEAVCPGVAYGRVFVACDDAALAECPDHAVLVTPRLEPSAALLRALRRAAALVSQEGRPSDPSASLIRSFRVPALLGAPGVLDLLASGQMVTVDAWDQVVYAGFFSELFHHELLQSAAAAEAPEYRLLNRIVRDLGSPLAMSEVGVQPAASSLFALLRAEFDDTLRSLSAAEIVGPRSEMVPWPGLGADVPVVETVGGGVDDAPDEPWRAASPAAALLGAFVARGRCEPAGATGLKGFVMTSPEDVFALLAAGERVVALDGRVSLRRASGHLMLWCSGGPSDDRLLATVRLQAERLGMTALRSASSVVAWREPLPAGSNRERLAGAGELAALAVTGVDPGGAGEEARDGNRS